MKKTEKISVLISIVLISLIAIGAVSAADDTAAADDADLAAIDEVQTIDDTTIDDDIGYGSEDIIVTDTGDSGDSDAISDDATKTGNLGANQLTDGDTLSFTNLSDKVSNGGFVQLKDNYVYNPTTDSRFVDGITITKDTTLMGNNGLYKVDGSNTARLFKIANGATLTLIGLTLTGGHADQGGAIYIDNGQLAISDSKFTGNSADYGGAVYATANGGVIGGSDFTNNVATYRGGAIYSEGTVDLSDSVIDSNDITYRARNDDNGGAAIYNNGGTLNLDGVQVTNNLKNIVIRNGNDGDLINAAIFTNGRAYITNSNISKNSGSWGAGIYVIGDWTLTVTDTTFEENMATFGAAIYSEGADVVVERCTFTKNHCEGVGSSGTSNTQGGAILIMSEGASAIITDSTFTQNSANTGGAVSISQATGDVLIDNCQFVANTASNEGGAIYNYAANGATLTVKDSTFQDNTATNFGDAISNDAALKLERNTVTGGRPAAIGTYFGTVDSDVYVKILNGETVTTTSASNEITAILTDDNGNRLIDRNLVLIVDGNEVATPYDKATGIQKGTCTLTNPGTYEITAKDYDAAHTTTGTLVFESSLTSLQNIINENTNGTIDLTYGFAYIDSLDSALKETGIVVDKNIILNGNGVTIDGADVSRLFKVTNGATLTLNDVVLANGFAGDGADVYVDAGSKLTATGSTFKDSSATYSGGAIYALGEVSLTDCIIDNNDITDRSKNNNTGGAAIFLNNTSLTLVNTQITNNGKDFKYSTEYGNARDLLSGVVQLIDSDATISGSLFENNAACYGGAINIINTGGTVENLKVTDSRFINNKAYDGAGINIEQATFEIAGCTFTNNQAIGVGSPDYASAGGGIAFSKDLSSGTVTDSTFTGNSATWGGAIYSNPRDTAHSVIIDGCTFTDNTASEKGGGVFFNGYNLTVSNSAFTGNTAPLGESIYNGGYVLYLTKNTIDNSITCNGDVSLSENTIGGYINLGKDTTKLLSNVIITINDNGTYTAEAYDIFKVKAKVTDDNGNIIRTYNDKIGIWCGPSSVSGSQPGKLTFNEETGLYEADVEVVKSGRIYMGNLGNTFPYVNRTLVTEHSAYVTVTPIQRTLEVTYENITFPGTVTVSVKISNEKTGVPLRTTVYVTINGVKKSISTNAEGIGQTTFEDLADGTYVLNASANANTNGYTYVEQLHELVVYPQQGTYKDLQYRIEHAVDGVLDLPYDFTYNQAYDGDELATGVVISSDLTINGNGKTICGNELARVFKVTNDAALTLKDVTICHGAADQGAGIYVESGATLKAEDTTFTLNTATTKGGAIYSEGTVDLKDSVIKENYISKRDGAGDENKGGAALYNKGGTATLDNVTVVDNLKDYVNGDVLDGAVVAMGKTTITNSNFTNNYGRYGGAITQTETDETLTVENTIFEDNYAIFGGAIYDSGAPLVVKDSKFYNNSGVGPGSAGTSSSQGGAILVMGENAGLDLKGSDFINNTADLGGAVAVSSGTTGTFTIDDCTFTENKANDEGGAIYGYTTDSPITVSNSEFTKNNGGSYGGAIEADGDTDLNVIDSKFTQNSASYGGAIITGGNTVISGSTFTGNDAASLTEAIYSWYSGKTLALTGNTITDDGIQIYAANGVIMTTPLKVRILDNDTVNIHMAPYDITGVVTDDNGNALVYMSLRFKVGDDIVSGLSVDIATGVYKTTFTPTQTGEFVVSTNLADATLVETGVLKISRSLTDLANIIAAAEAGAEITLDGDYAYIPEFDADLVNGIVIDKAITIKGAEGADTISGSDLARLFKVVNGGELTLDGVTITDGKAADGAGIYLESGAKLTATDSTFKDNTATYSGGAIYADNAQITLTDCVLDGNDATDATSNNDTGGAAIYGNSATIALVNTNVTNNGNKELDRTKGDLINGVINLMNSDATVTGCVFENNTGIYGGAITTQAPAGAKTLTIKESNFTANAAYTGGAVYVGDNVKYTIEDSIFDANNKATGEGSPGYTSGGGAIQIWHAGEGTIDNVTIKNSIATQGGAIGVEGATVTIKDSTFEGNTATSEGGAIYAYNDATTTVTGCTFTNNDAPFGSAISNDGTLSLSGNTITGGSVVPIANYYGTIISTVNVVTLDGQDVVTATATNDVTAILKDDNGNAIIDKTLVLIVNGEEITTSYNKVTGIMTGSCTLTQPGTYAVTAKGIDADHTVAGNLVYTAGTFTELQNLINAAEAGATITLDHDIVYNEAFDGDALKEGIVVDKAVTIVGADGIEICGNDLARVFKVANAAALTLKDITICDGAAEKGAGVFVESGASLVADNVTFTENVAVKRGGAVYSEGTVNIANSRIDKNNVTFRTENDDNGGAAIYNLGGTLTVTDTNITDNQNDIVPRDGNSGDYINSAIITTGDASFTGCNISKNSGSWGGGIYVNNGATLTVKDSVFEENFATFGAAIYDENAKVIIDNCNFTNNYCGGVGSPGTSNTQAGAVLVMGNGASATITNSKFNKNSAKTGGAVSISQATGDVLIDNCEFTENTASYEGGAIYNYIADGATLTVSNSKFTDNTATNWGDAISNDGALKLDKNTITGGRDAAIGNWLGTIDSKVVSRILENTTYNWHTSEFLINATLTDDNGNKINDKFFKFIITYTAFRGTIEVPATYYSDLGYYQGKFTPDKAGEYLINLGYENEEVATSVITVHKSLIDLANLIANDEDGIIDLDDDYAYIAEFDESIVNGIVIDKAVTINGAENANIINGSNLARLFDVTNGGTLTLNGVTIANGKADDGAGIYLESGAKLTATDSTFKDNTATYSGGAIYADGAEISLTNCVLDGNDVTDYTKNNDTGGAAIYGQSSTIALVNTNVTNNGNKELDRTKGDLVNGVINLMNSDATVTGCVFENNTGIYGGAITTQAPAGAKTLTISESNFTANAAYTGGAVYVGDNVKFTIEDSIFDANNKATGEGSPGYTSGGGAIQLWHAGEGIIDNVTIKNSIATQGGAIGVEGSSPVTIKDSTFTDNTATSEGGAIYAYNDAVLTVTGSTFSGNTAPWGNAISNDGTLTLSGNTVSTTSADIANYYGSIVSPITVSILGNDTTEGSGIVTAELGQTVTITGVITDDNKNLIKDINFDYKVTNGDNIKEVHAVYNADTKQYEAEYVIENAGDHLVTIISDANTNLIINTGLYQVEKAQATLVINAYNIKEGEKAIVEVELHDKDGNAFVGEDLIILVDGIDYNVTTGADGKYILEVPDLASGIYDAVAIYEGNANYVRAFDTTIFTVIATPILEVEGDDYLMPGATATVGITLTSKNDEGIAGTVIVTVDGKEYIVITDENGKGSVEIPGLANGKYPITAKFIGDNRYETVTNDTEFIDFYYRTATFDIVIDDYTYGDVITIIVENATDADGNPLNGMVFGNIEGAKGDGAGLAVRVENGAGTATIRKLIVDEYNVVATFTDETYEFISETKEFTFNVVKAQSAADVTYADGEFTITLDGVAGEKLNESVSVLIDGVAYDAQTTANGTITFAAPELAVGRHTIEVAFAGNDNYLGSADSFTFDIPKGIPTITVSGDVIDEGETATVTVTVKDGATGVAGNAVVTVNGVDYAVTIADNGVGTVDIDGLAYGEYPIAAKFLGNDDYEAAVYDGTAKVVVESDVATFDIVIENITYGEGLVVIVENATDAAGNPLNGMVIGNIENATGQGAGLIVYVTNGKGSRTITGLTAGDYEVSATFYDEDYEWFSETKEFTVNVAQAEPTVDVTYADGAITITLDGVNGEKLNETVTVAIDGTPINIAAVTENGTFTFTPSVAPGTHLVEVEFAGNHNYVAGSDYTSFEVPKATPIVEVNDTEAEWGTSVDIPVKVTDESGNPVTGTVIVIVDWLVDGKSYVVELDENGMGTAHFVINEATGDLTITARFMGNDNFTDKNATATLTITESTDLEIEASANEPDFGEDTIITVTGKDGMGAVVPITAVNVTIDGVTTEYPVAGDGTVNLGKLPVGETEITVSVDDGKHKAATETINITVDPAAGVQLSASAANYAIGETGTLIVTVKDNDGKPLDGPLYIEIDGEIYLLGGKAIDGGAEIALTNLAVGDHVAVVTFANSSYLPVDYTTHFTVTKATPVITVTGDVIDLEEVATVNVTVMDGTTPVSGNAVVTVNGVSYAVTIAADGRGFVDIENLPFGEYAITAKFLGNDNYEAVDYTGDAKVIVNSDAITYDIALNDDNTLVTISNVKDAAGNDLNGYIMSELLKDGQKYENLDFAYLTDGTGTITVPGDLLPGEYTVLVTVLTTTGATIVDNVSFTVEAMSGVQVNANAANYPFTQNGSLEITVTDADGNVLNGTAYIEIDGEIYPLAGNVINGQATVDLTGLAVGDHVAVVTFDNPKYLPSEFTTHFTVTKATPAITVTGDSIEVGETATVTVTVMDGTTPVAGNAVVTVNGIDYAVTVGADGKGTLTIVDLPYGEYAIAAKFLSNDNYEAADFTGTAKVIVDSDEITFDLVVNDDNTAVTVSNAKDAAGNDLDGYILGELFKDGQKVQDLNMGSLEDGTGTISIPSDLLPGDYTAMISIMTDDGSFATENVTFTVEPLTGATVTVTDNQPTLGEDAKVTVAAKDGQGNPLAGTALVSIDGGAPQEVTIGPDGTIEIDLGDELAAGEHTVAVTFTNDYYEPVTETATITVANKTGATVGITDNSPKPTDDAAITIEAKDGQGNPLAGTALVSIDGGAPQEVPIDSTGKATVDAGKLGAGEHNIEVTFQAEGYDPVTQTATIEIAKANNATLTVAADPIKEGENATVNVTLVSGEEKLSGVVIVTVDGVNYAVEVADGTGSVDIKNLAANTYPITAKFIGNDDYEATTATGSFTVSPYTEVTATVVADGQNIVVTLTDSEGNPVSGKVNVTIDGVGPEEKEVGADGKLVIPAEDGTHQVTVSYPGDESHPASEVTESIVTGKTVLDTSITLEASNVEYGQAVNVKVTLKDANGVGISGIVNVTIGNQTKEVTVTSGEGSITFEGLNANKYTAIGEYEGTEDYAASAGFIIVEVTKLGTAHIYEDMETYAINTTEDGYIGKFFIWTLVDSNGKPLANKDVQIGFNGKIYNKTTDENGVARLQINLQRYDIYTFGISYAGDENYNSSFAIAKITVKRQTGKLTVPNKSYKASAKTKTLTATFKSIEGNPAVGRKVTFTVKGKTYTAYTNDKGVASVNVSLDKKGTYNFTAKVAADNTYAAITKTATLKIT